MSKAKTFQNNLFYRFLRATAVTDTEFPVNEFFGLIYARKLHFWEIRKSDLNLGYPEIGFKIRSHHRLQLDDAVRVTILKSH